ncbi:MAG TPA: MFS transporter [Amycolatopsis sp.]|nr:MFS transporter [Amycolatopsis sp.]
MTTVTEDPRPAHAAGKAAGGRRQVLEPLSGLLLALFVAILSGTIVSNALPRILSELGGTQAEYTWVVSASLLAMTASTPIWGKLADLFSKKLLVQLSIVIFIVGSVLCGTTQSTTELIGLRVVQGLGMGGLQALAQVVIAAIIPPRERGRYTGYLGAVMAVAVVGGPLIGGVIVDTSWLGWRWCFFITVPFAAIALVVLQRTLSVPTIKREVHIDYLGAALIAGGVSALLVWTSLAGKDFAWVSWPSLAWVGGGLAALALAVLVESRAAEPVVPLRLFRDRTITMATVAGLFVGVAMFGSTVFLSQFFQLARGATATEAGLLTLPLIGAMFLSSTVAGQLITKYGKWKRFLVLGGVLLTAGLALQAGFISATAPYWELAVFMALVGLGVGMTQQNLVLAVQNSVAMRDMGAASSTVAFFRSLGGAVGVAGLGAVLSTGVSDKIASGLAALGVPAGATATSGGQIPQLSALPGPIRAVVETAYGDGTAHVFLFAAPLAAIALIAILFLREIPLRRTIDLAADGDAGTPPAGQPSTSELPGQIHGRLRSPEGMGVSGGVVTVTSADGRQVARARTDESGAYAIEVSPSGTYTLIVTASGFRPEAASVTVNGTGAVRDFVVIGDGVVTGTVRRSDGSVVAGATVVATDASGQVVGRADTGADGAFRFAGLPSGEVTLTADIAGQRPRAVTVPVGSEPAVADLLVETTARLYGTVAGPDGQGLAGVTVAVADAAGTPVAVVVTGPDGRYEVPDLPLGEYTVLTRLYEPSAREVELTPGRPATVDVELTPAWHNAADPV